VVIPSGGAPSLKVSNNTTPIRAVSEERENQGVYGGDAEEHLTCVMKFGGSSLASAERMREVADLVISFPEERPVIVLSAMGKTTNNLLLVSPKLNLFTCFCYCVMYFFFLVQ